MTHENSIKISPTIKHEFCCFHIIIRLFKPFLYFHINNDSYSFFGNPITLWLTLRNLKKLPAYGTAVRYQFDDEQVSVSGKGSALTCTWESWHEVVFCPAGMLLYVSPAIVHCIPKHAFSSPEDFAAAKELVRQHMSPKRTYRGQEMQSLLSKKSRRVRIVEYK